jgi:hypothetical protein
VRAAGKAGFEALADGIGKPARLHAIVQRPEGEEGGEAVLVAGPVIGQAGALLLEFGHRRACRNAGQARRLIAIGDADGAAGIGIAEMPGMVPR